jgi:archaellum component FlaC
MEQKKFELKDFMTAKQASEAIEYMNSLEKRIDDLEHEVANLTNLCQQLNYLITWQDVINLM